MFLKRVTIAGFKSFAAKTVLDLEPGITGIVGPNGSGKSNLADAVRWAMGEQSKAKLRLGDREEVVFAGTEKRPKASMAEVTLLFDNEDGAFPLDLAEVEISRRLYRSGEADYRLAGRSARLADIQELLAQAGLGVGSYAVIGQGMIDSFLVSSPAERKLLFEEAAGIRGPELKREAAVRKLAATSANLTRLRDIAAELGPRLASLERAVSAAAEKQVLQERVRQLRIDVISAGFTHWTSQCEQVEGRLADSAAQISQLQKAAADHRQQLAAGVAAAAQAARERERMQQTLSKLEHARDVAAWESGECQAAVRDAEKAQTSASDLAKQLAGARRELASAQARYEELQSNLHANSESTERALHAVERTNHTVGEAQAALVQLRKFHRDGTKDQYVHHALQILKTLATSLAADKLTKDEIRLLVHKAGRLLSHASRDDAAELLENLKNAQKKLESAMAKREVAVEHQTNITITRRSIEIDLAHQAEAVSRGTERAESVQKSHAEANAAATHLREQQKRAERAAAALKEATETLEARRRQLSELSAASDPAPSQAELATALERAKAALTAAQLEHERLAADRTAAQAGLEATRRQAKEWGIPASATTKPAATLPELNTSLVMAEARLEAHAAVKLGQATEYEEVQARHADLTAQIGDLEQAGADLEHMIEQLDGIIKERFSENFQALSEQFSAYFTRLFGGGTAALSLCEAEDGTYGIDIDASPKGKRHISLAALSGGERALAGVALIAAILRVNPSPFVVLDEIDAALDEANSDRLAGILTELADHSQLLIITHNRRIMSTSRVLFGVTSTDRHASHLLTMRLEEAAELAAR